MTRVESTRAEVQRLLRAAPFHPFAMNLENGDRVVAAHPENIAFDPVAKEGSKWWGQFCAISNGLVFFSNFAAVTSVAPIDQGQPTA
ncbi:MAG TPA: hypothetical protein VMS17_05695 [Gemmataceae bacterium]|nr:hypothetical protein [Gemmataceae bacterium]